MTNAEMDYDDATSTNHHVTAVRGAQTNGVEDHEAGLRLMTERYDFESVDAQLMYVHGWRTGHRPPCACPVYFNGDNANPC